jgi:hypothetical protein
MSSASIQTLRRGLSEWAQHEGHQRFLRDDQQVLLEEFAGVPERRTQANVAAWMLGTWQLGNGMHRVLEGDAEGFDEARVGQSLRRAALLSRARHQRAPRRGPRPRLPFSLLHGAWTALLGLALDDPDAEPLYELLLSQPDASFGASDHLALFARELLLLRAAKMPTLSSRLGPYQDVLQLCDGASEVLALRLSRVLDRHLAEAGRAGADFDDPACRLYPVEVIAVRNVRQWLELPTPKVEHALMFTNLGQMTPRTPWPDSELALRLEPRGSRR